jgi:hypothetical protein
MFEQVITSPAQITTEWLTSALTKSGALLEGQVQAFQIEPFGSSWANFCRIQIQYTIGAVGSSTLPTSLLLKMCQGTFGPSEVAYYTQDYAGLDQAPIPKCYHAAYSEEPRSYHLLVADLAATHHNSWETIPTLEYGLAVIEALALLHAYWWNPYKLAAAGKSIASAPEISRYIEHIQAGLAPLLAEVGADIKPEWAEKLRQIFAKHPAKMLERTKNPAGFTLVHGDTNPGNILTPLVPTGNNYTYLIDRQPFDWSLTTWLGVSDLTYLIVTWWEPAIRRQLEIPLLRHYHQKFVQQGITDYSWEMLLSDYKLCAVQSVYVAVEWCILEEDRQNKKWIWWPQLQKAMTAFFELNCDTILL